MKTKLHHFSLLLFFLNFSLIKATQKEEDNLPYGWSMRANGKGWRETKSILWRQEDRVGCTLKEDGKTLLFFLFDGHGGDRVSDYAHQNIHRCFDQVIGETAEEKLKNTAQKLAQEIDQLSSQDDLIDYMGSTAIIGLLQAQPNKKSLLTVAWLGDSRLIVTNNNNQPSVCFSTTNHDLENLDERVRVTNQKGSISNNRVNGCEVTRALGDKGLREDCIISTPEIKQITLTEENPFLIFASDGALSDTILTDTEAVNIAREIMDTNTSNLEKYSENPIVTQSDNTLFGEKDPVEEGGNRKLKLVARALREEAVIRGSKDNISVAVIDLIKFMKNNESNKSQLKHEQQTISSKINQLRNFIYRNPFSFGLFFISLGSIATYLYYIKTN